MQIVLSEHAGFCFGVKRAVELIENELNKNEKKIYTLGHIIHNEVFNESLKKRGVINISEDEITEDFPENSVVFVRTHGITKSTSEKLRKNKIVYVDATCPFVKKIHDIVKSETEKADKSDEDIVFLLLGDENHPEVLGIVSFAGKYPVKVISHLSDLEEYCKTANKGTRHVFLSQTTQSLAEWNRCLIYLKTVFENLTVYSTICNVTETRQRDAERIASEADVMVVVGGKNSSNTKKLATVCEKHCKTLLVSSASEIDKNIFVNEMTVGVTAGASTPEGIIKEVIKCLKSTTK